MQYNYALKLFIIIRLYKQIEIKINKYYDFHHIYLTILKFLMTFAGYRTKRVGTLIPIIER